LRVYIVILTSMGPKKIGEIISQVTRYLFTMNYRLHSDSYAGYFESLLFWISRNREKVNVYAT